MHMQINIFIILSKLYINHIFYNILIIIKNIATYFVYLHLVAWVNVKLSIK